MTIDELIEKICGDRPNEFFLECGRDWAVYQEVGSHWEDDRQYFTQEEIDECRAAGRMWTAQYYPRTPISFLVACGPTAQIALERLLEKI